MLKEHEERLFKPKSWIARCIIPDIDTDTAALGVTKGLIIGAIGGVILFLFAVLVLGVLVALLF